MYLAMRIKKFETTFILALLSTFSYCQADSMLNDFTAVVSGNRIVLDWEISEGSLCNGIKIERSDDNLNWTEVGEIVGQCGSIDEPQPYQFIDTEPIPNATNYYRLQLGTAGATSSINIKYIELGSDGYKVAPNPITTTAKIYFNNPNALSYCLKVTDITGELVYIREDIRTNTAEFDRAGLEQGYYFFTLLFHGKVKYSGKLVVN